MEKESDSAQQGEAEAWARNASLDTLNAQIGASRLFLVIDLSQS